MVLIIDAIKASDRSGIAPASGGTKGGIAIVYHQAIRRGPIGGVILIVGTIKASY